MQLERASPTPLWAQLLEDLRRRAASAELAGSFPAEHELAAAYGVSRNTVREAMRHLRADGTVVSGRGRRPRLGQQIRQPLGSFYSLFESLRAAGLEQHSIVRRLEECRNADAAAQLGMAADEPLMHAERLRLVDGEPLAVDRIWLPARRAAAMLGADLAERGFYEELARLTGVRLSGGEEHVRAVVPSAAQRRELAIGRSTAAFSIERLGRVGAEPFEWRRTLVRADRFSVFAEFTGPLPAGEAGRELLAAGTLTLRSAG